jgi:predicted transcriptional regulator
MSEKANKKIKENKDKILKLIAERGKMHIKEIADNIDMSPATTSKYLGILEAEKKVKRHDDQPPYVYWTLNERNDGQETS